MRAFSELFTNIDQTASTNEKIDALVSYFATADEQDAIWCVALLSGRAPRRTVKTSELWEWSGELSGLPVWLQAESYHIVGDLAETISLLLPSHHTNHDYSLHQIIHDLIDLKGKDDAERKKYITHMWQQFNKQELFVFNKFITGGFRMGVSDKIIIKALAKHYNIDENIVAHRLSGGWEARGNTLNALLSNEDGTTDISRPYPFYLAYPLETAPEELGDVSEWQIERKYDGIRGQIIIRNNTLFVWSRGEDLMTEKFVEFHNLVNMLPDGIVIDGEILPMKDGIYLPFHVMQTRIGRKNVTKKTLQDAPLVMVCYDILEHDGVDVRHLSMQERRAILENVINDARSRNNNLPLLLSPVLECNTWQEVTEERTRSRDNHCEGLMLKKKDSEYKTGRRRGDWWKWKVDPLSIDGVMLYAQRGHGRRADLYTDFTFAVWDGDELVPFCKAYSGLTDKEMLQVDAWIKKNTLDKFGPVRSVTPTLVFEIGFEGINPSPRHKSGVALRFPRILRWRQDKTAKEANTKADLMELLNIYGIGKSE
ncbi:MAG: ATP-dependent ligase [Flavipsychrobacter sp.]|nr:ATP-dependent ligase [Flavipsychrobacter sp.]